MLTCFGTRTIICLHKWGSMAGLYAYAVFTVALMVAVAYFAYGEY
jgi:hypothetical protein